MDCSQVAALDSGTVNKTVLVIYHISSARSVYLSGPFYFV
jgi:hypothetical protein